MAKEKKSYRGEHAWINKKLRQGIRPDVLRNSIGAFSNRKKETVMKEKGLSEREYKKRYKFLGNVYYLLSSKY